MLTVPVLGCGLAACSAMNEVTLGRAVTWPGQFNTYSCDQIEAALKTAQKRRIELEQLMARSSQSPGGDFVNLIAYRSGYISAVGDYDVLVRESADKHCVSKYSSGRAVY
jgi:hypothetical protein